MPGADEKPGINDGLGCCYMGIFNLDDSLLYFNKAVEKEPHNPEFLMNRA